MSTPVSPTLGHAKLLRLPVPLRELLQKPGGLPHVRELALLVDADQESADIFLRLARSSLPSRRIASVAEAVPLLGVILSTRLALLAAGSSWLRQVLGDSPMLHPVLRHCIAAAVVAEALGRETGDLPPPLAYGLGLMHHFGDAALIAGERDGGVHGYTLTSSILAEHNAPAVLVEALDLYARVHARGKPVQHAIAQLLAAADHAATRFGYAAPHPCGEPVRWGSRLPQMELLNRAQRRLSASIEDIMGVVVEAHLPISAFGVSAITTRSPIVRPDLNESVSIRDLGPLPVLFARIADAGDVDVLTSALTAGLVEELGVSRAWFLHMADAGVLKGGALSSRGNVPLPLHDEEIPLDTLPPALRAAMVGERPMILPNAHASGPLSRLMGNASATTLFVPVAVSKEILGLLGVEMAPGADVVPDLIAAVASHAGLALKAVHLKRLSDKAKIDELTGLFNRRGILDKLDVALAQSVRTGQDLAIALVDCDHLKKVNDNFGHLMGDELVRRVSEVIHLSLRAADEVGRYGGDEFLVVLPETSYEEVVMAMERARERVERAGLESEDGLLLSVSIGAVVRGGVDAPREDLLKMADNALYRSKEVGRNAVTVVRAQDAILP